MGRGDFFQELHISFFSVEEKDMVQAMGLPELEERNLFLVGLVIMRCRRQTWGLRSIGLS